MTHPGIYLMLFRVNQGRVRLVSDKYITVSGETSTTF